jgi:hypothetical protein
MKPSALCPTGKAQQSPRKRLGSVPFQIVQERRKRTEVRARRNGINGKSTMNHPKPGGMSNDVIIGTGQSQTLGAVNRERNSQDNVNKQCIGVFISRLKSKVTEKHIELHIKHETGFSVRPERLATKYQTYRSYFIPCNKAVRYAILNAELWPAPTLLKPFYN